MRPVVALCKLGKPGGASLLMCAQEVWFRVMRSDGKLIVSDDCNPVWKTECEKEERVVSIL
jgi:hypothetical protein